MSSTEEEMQTIKQRNRYMVKQRNRGQVFHWNF